MSCANQNQAAREARALLIRSLPGSRHGSVKGHIKRAEHIAEKIWRRFQRGPHQWQQKDVRWFLTAVTSELASPSRYDYWRTVRVLLNALQKFEAWEPLLQGPWIRPTGERGAMKVGRPPKLPGNIF